MHWAASIATGLAIGMVSGRIAEALPVPSVAQTVMAVLAAWVLTTALLVWRLAQKYRGQGYFGIGLDNLAWLAGAGVMGAVIHVAVGAIDPAIPLLIDHRPTILGGAAGVFVGLSLARLEAVSDHLPRTEGGRL